MSDQICVNCDAQAGYPHKEHCPCPKFVGEPDRFSPNWAADTLAKLRPAFEQTRRDVVFHRSVIFALLRMFPPAELLKAIHKAFGAPGDWGYGTPLGDMLCDLYDGKK